MSDSVSNLPASGRPTRPRRRVMLNVLFATLTKVQSAFFTYATTLLILRALAVEDYGLYALLFSGMLYNLGLIARLGMGNVLIRFVPEYFAQSDYHVIGRLLRVANLTQAAVSVAIVAAGATLGAALIAKMNFAISSEVIVLYAIGASVYLLADNFRVLFAGVFQQRLVLAVNIGYNIARLAAIYWATHQTDVLRSVICAETIAFTALLCCYAVAHFVVVRPRTKHAVPSVEHLPWRRFLRYGAWAYMNEVGVTLISSQTDLFVVTSLLDQADVAYYGLANRIFGMALHLLPDTVLQDVIGPLFYSEYGGESKIAAGFGFSLLVKLSLLASLPLGFWLAIMSHLVIVQFFDARYGAAAAILSVTGVFLFTNALRSPFGIMLANAERQDLLLYTRVLGVVKILVSLWLVPWFGAIAMAWISGLSSLATCFAMYGFIVWKIRVQVDYRGVARILTNGVLSGAALWVMRPLFNSAVGVVLSIPLFIVLYISANLVFRAFSPEERNLINSKLPYPLWRF